MQVSGKVWKNQVAHARILLDEEALLTTAVALTLYPEKILAVKKTAKQDVAVAQKRVNFALGMLGHCVDFIGSWVVGSLNQRLQNDLVLMKGLVSLVPDLDPSRILDPRGELVQGLGDLQRAVNELHGGSLRARDDIKLRRTHGAFQECVELCVALHDAVGELKKAIARHDSGATMGDDARRLIADLKRTDDVPAGKYAELASALRSAERGTGGRAAR